MVPFLYAEIITSIRIRRLLNQDNIYYILRENNISNILSDGIQTSFQTFILCPFSTFHCTTILFTSGQGHRHSSRKSPSAPTVPDAAIDPCSPSMFVSDDYSFLPLFLFGTHVLGPLPLGSPGFPGYALPEPCFFCFYDMPKL